jgi:hypothetical protein
MPPYEGIEWEGLDFSKEEFQELMAVDREDWKAEVLSHEELFAKLYDRLPKEFIFMRELILSSLWRSPEHWELTSELNALLRTPPSSQRPGWRAPGGALLLLLEPPQRGGGARARRWGRGGGTERT